MRQFILFLGTLCLAAAGPARENQNVHELMTDEEKMELFRTAPHAIPEHEIVPVYWPRQHKRSNGLLIKLKLKAFGKNIKLWLNPTEGILAGYDTPVYAAISQNMKPKVRRLKLDMAKVGKILEDREHKATFMVKNSERGKRSLSGVVGSQRWVVKPLPDNLSDNYSRKFRRSTNDVENLQNDTTEYNEPHYHVVYKQPEQVARSKAHYASPTMEEKFLNKELTRSKREEKVPSIIYPETLIFIDYQSYKFHGEDPHKLLEYMLPFWNGVDLGFRSLENPKVRLNIAGIVIGTDPKALPFIWKHLEYNVGVYAGGCLDDFTKYLQYLEGLEDAFSKTRYDIAVVMGPYDVCFEKADDCDNLGLSDMGGACTNKRTSIIKDMGVFDGVMTAVHELGHLFGVQHDGEDYPECKNEDGYIMAVQTVFTKNTADWSPCSVKAFDTFFRSLNGSKPSCLFNKPRTTHPLPRVIPARHMTMDEQCNRLFGTKSCNIKYRRIEDCTVMYCENPDKSKKCILHYIPADGTICGIGKICIHNKCILQSEIL